ncbi:MAG TPA: plastocyanin/azurin family copper-binding protein, partial [Tangfeifania sp.]|nr:plastocyanin/azurin family copper-binding protein [Tangfeifania sp.]
MKAIFTLKNDARFKKLMMLAAVLIIAVITSSAQEKHIVEVSNNVFTPDELQIAAGDTVEWRNIEGIHNVNGSQGTFPENPESFGNSTGSGWTYSHVFNIAGSYDYRCDPHYTLGMTGKIEVTENDDVEGQLAVNFVGMTPHVGQDLWLAVVNKNTGMEVDRVHAVVEEEFMVHAHGIEAGESYNVDFFADFNENG